MPQNEKTLEQLSRVVFSWQYPEFVVYHKDKRWYVISLIVLVLALAWTIYDKNYLFSAFLLLFYLLVIFYESRQPEMIDFTITEDGVKSGDNFYYFKDIDHFYVVYQAQGVKNLYLEFRNPLRSRLIVPLVGQNAVAVRDFLLQHLAEDLEREAEPLSEQLRRWLRL
ncbi:MAG: hypothetical protein WCT16_00385 [Candidatus Buchananbacteria bacterium]